MSKMSWFDILKDEQRAEDCCQEAKGALEKLYSDLIILEKEKPDEEQYRTLSAKLSAKQLFEQMAGRKISYTRTHELRDLIADLEIEDCDDLYRMLRKDSIAMPAEVHGEHLISERPGRSPEEKRKYKILKDWEKCDAGDWHDTDPGPADRQEFRRKWS